MSVDKFLCRIGEVVEVGLAFIILFIFFNGIFKLSELCLFFGKRLFKLGDFTAYCGKILFCRRRLLFGSECSQVLVNLLFIKAADCACADWNVIAHFCPSDLLLTDIITQTNYFCNENIV